MSDLTLEILVGIPVAFVIGWGIANWMRSRGWVK